MAIVALTLFSALNVTVWILVQPPAAAPDEAAYMKVVTFLEEHERFPVFDEDPGMGVEALTLLPNTPPYAYRSYADRPGLSFVLAAVALRLPGDGPRHDYTQARLPGIAYAALFTLLTAALGFALWPGRPVQTVAFTAIAASWPQVSVVMASVNDDGLTLLFAAALFVCWLRGARSGWPIRWTVALGACMGLGLLAKPSGYVLLAATALVAILTLRGSAVSVLGRLGAAVVSMLAVAGWRIVIAFQDYGLDPFNFQRTEELVDSLGASTFPARGAGVSFLEMVTGSSLVTPVGGGAWPSTVGSTMFAAITSNRYTLPVGILMTVFAFASIAAVELLLGATTRRWSLRTRWQSMEFRVRCVMHAMIVVFVAGLAWRNYTVDYIPGGQYLLPILLPVLVLLVEGLVAFGATRLRITILLVALVTLLFVANYRAMALLRGVAEVSVLDWLDDERALVTIAWPLSVAWAFAIVVAVLTRASWAPAEDQGR